jgi:DNA-directed RNA polymerase I subunit RPA2
MAPSAQKEWSVEYDTLRRERLFRHPPKDGTAYPSLAAAILPHIDSFNALFDGNGVLEKALEDIGTKSFLDGDTETAEQRKAWREEGKRPPRRNKLDVRITELFLEKAVLPPTNKFSTRNREIYPVECRERHATYRGKLRARLEYRVNNEDWKESVRELGLVPIMLRVSYVFARTHCLTGLG